MIINKLTPLPVAKSTSAFIREYDLCTKDFKFDANTHAKKWLEEFVREANAQDKAKATEKKVTIRMSPKKRAGIAA